MCQAEDQNTYLQLTVTKYEQVSQIGSPVLKTINETQHKMASRQWTCDISIHRKQNLPPKLVVEWI